VIQRCNVTQVNSDAENEKLEKKILENMDVNNVTLSIQQIAEISNNSSIDEFPDKLVLSERPFVTSNSAGGYPKKAYAQDEDSESRNRYAERSVYATRSMMKMVSSKQHNAAVLAAFRRCTTNLTNIFFLIFSFMV
jgi:hypothetical protein